MSGSWRPFNIYDPVFPIVMEDSDDSDNDLPLEEAVRKGICRNLKSKTDRDSALGPRISEDSDSVRLTLQVGDVDIDMGDVPVTDATDAEIIEIDEFISEMAAKNTLKKTQCCVKNFTEFLLQKNILTEIQHLEPDVLNHQIGLWLMQLKNGVEDYEPGTILGFHRGICRFLRSKHYGEDPLTSGKFETSRAVLTAKRKSTKQAGKGNRPNRAEELSYDEEEKLWEKKIFGSHSAQSLLQTVWYFIGLCFFFRGNDEHRQLEFGDIKITTDENGRKLAKFNERTTKTRKGTTRDSRPFPPVMTQNLTNPNHCPLFHLEMYLAKRPTMANDADAPFYLHPAAPSKISPDTWYSQRPLGINALGKMMKRIAFDGGLTGRLTNHSIRRTAISRLAGQNVEATIIAQLSGHRNINSINNYSIATKKQRLELCDQVLNDPTTRKPLQVIPENLAPSPAPAGLGVGMSGFGLGLFSGANFNVAAGGNLNIYVNQNAHSSNDVRLDSDVIRALQADF